MSWMFNISEAFESPRKPFKRTNGYIKYIVKENPIPQYEFATNWSQCNVNTIAHPPWLYHDKQKYNTAFKKLNK